MNAVISKALAAHKRERARAQLEPGGLPRALDLESAKQVLVFAPHPDDETLGCGGTLALLAKRCRVTAVLVTDGSGAGALPPGTAERRQAEFARALDALGVADHACLGEPDGAFRDSPAFRDKVRALLDRHRPDWVFMPSPLDYHRDHVRIGAAIASLCRRARSVERLVFYEIWSPLPATHVVDITSTVEQKRKALRCHETALACRDYERAAFGLNEYRSLYLDPSDTPRWAEAFWVEDAGHEGLYGRAMDLALALLERLR